MIPLICNYIGANGIKLIDASVREGYLLDKLQMINDRHKIN